MTFSYSGDPANSDLDQLRFTLADTDVAFQLLSDEELTWLAGQWMPRYDSLTFVASIAAATISRKFTGIVSVSADGVSVNTSELAERYSKMALGLRKEYKDSMAPGSPIWGDTSERCYRIGLHDIAGAGLQDYGDLDVSPSRSLEWLDATGVFP